jgi:7-carboxy-7-deazaguanine synthase
MDEVKLTQHVLPVAEIFASLQGEGLWTGTPMMFLRLSGCNLNCPWCDTDHDSEGLRSIWEIVHELVDQCWRQFGAPADEVRVCITGGEPTIHGEDVLLLVDALREVFKTTHIESNGTHPEVLRPLLHHKDVYITISPKFLQFDYSQMMAGRQLVGDELKVVLEPALEQELIREVFFLTRQDFLHHFIQPCDLGDSYHRREMHTQDSLSLAAKFVKGNSQWRLSVQMQKVLQIQ